MLFLLLFSLIVSVFADDYKTVVLEDGIVRGEKYWNGDFYEFHGIPYASVPKGRDRFKAPLPAEPWEGVMEANARGISCPQVYITDDEDDDTLLDGEEDCLTLDLIVPEIANEDNPTPVLVYIHSGAFSGGSGHMAKFHYLARHDVITVSFNYRIGAIGFLCLGNEEIPGNAALKDQVAALKWINKNIAKFGGDPNKITLAGFSVGASMAEILALSKATDGLFHQLILESGSALSPFAIDINPYNTAKNLAISIGYNDTGKLRDLTNFLLNATIKDLATKSKNFHLKNATFGIGPCIEVDPEGILTEHPLIILEKGTFKRIPVLTGFSNMEGISRTNKFGEWNDDMNDHFEEYLPVDLSFDSDKTRDEIIKEIKTYYFKDEEVSHDTLQEYIDYFSDSMFKYSIMRSAKLYAEKAPVFLYEFMYVGKLNFKHYYMDRIKGASHRDQTAYILDFYDHTNRLTDLDTRDRLTVMWTDFVKYGNPTVYESLLIDIKWLKYTKDDQNYLEISKKLKKKKDLFAKRYDFWNKVYQKYHWKATK